MRRIVFTSHKGKTVTLKLRVVFDLRESCMHLSTITVLIADLTCEVAD